MDGNERLLSRVLQERSSHHRPVGIGSTWLVVGAVVLVLGATAAGLHLAVSRPFVEVSTVGDAAAVEALTAGSPGLTAQHAVPTNLPSTLGSQAAAASRPRQYIVQPGDSLESIAARNGLRPTTLASANDLTDPDLLQPGLELVVPAADGLVHVVEPGETLRQIAAEYDVDMATLVMANNLPDPDHITVGLRLFIPAATPPLSAQDQDR